MIRLYVVSGCRASQKARKWLKDNHLDFEEIRLKKNSKNIRADLLHITSLLEGGVFDLVATRSKNYSRLEKRFSTMTLSQFLDYLVSEPKLIKHPIICDGRRVQLGFNSDDIRVFIPKDIRRIKAKMIIESLK